MALLQKKVDDPRAPTVFDKLLGAKIRTVRITRERSLGWVAKRVYVSYQMMQNYENGKARLSVGRFVAICRELNVPPGKMLQGL